MKKQTFGLIACMAVYTATLIIMDGCVSKKKFTELSKKKVRLEADFAECQDTAASLKKSKEQLQVAYNKATDKIKSLTEDSSQLADNLARTKVLLDDQTGISERLRKDYKELLANYSAESNKLSSNLAKKEQQLLDRERELQQQKTKNDQLLSDLQEREKRLKELEKILKSKDSAVTMLRNKVTEALLAFKDKGLTVSVKNGKVYVSLSEKLLFESGSVKVDKKGEEALKRLADVLKSQRDVNIMVEGHTDDVPVSKGSAVFQDNWDLSVLRATEITRILIGEGLDGKRVTPSGHAEYIPVAEGKTTEARQKNRRTEIILTPKLDELFKILDNN